MCFYGCEDDEVRQVHENCYDEFITLEEGVWFRFSWIKTRLNTFAVAVTPTSMWLWQACSAVSLCSHSCSVRAATQCREEEEDDDDGDMWAVMNSSGEDSDLTTKWAPARAGSSALSAWALGVTVVFCPPPASSQMNELEYLLYWAGSRWNYIKLKS